MKTYIRQFLAAALVLLLPAATAFAGGKNVRSGSGGSVNRPSGGSGSGSGGGANKGSAQNAASNRNSNTNRNTNTNSNTNVNRNTNVNTNKNVNRNTNVNVNRDVDIDVDVNHRGGYGYNNGCCYNDNHGIAAAAIIGTAMVTSAIIGSTVNTLPPSCTVVIANGITYQQCGGAYYQPQFVGGNTTYVVVNSPY